MTRKRLYSSIRLELERRDLYGEECLPVVDASVDGTLNYILSFAQDISTELIVSGLYSEAMVSGVFVQKLKALLGEIDL